MVLDKLRDYPIEIHLMNGYNVFLGFIRTILLSDFSLFQSKKNPLAAGLKEGGNS
jgi:hypothetical protein